MNSKNNARGMSSMRYQSPLKFVIAIALVILAAEILIMYFLSAFTGLSAAAKAILDGIILVLLVSPVLYYCCFRTLMRQIKEVERVEDKLSKLYRAVEQSPSIVMITDTQGMIEYVNPKFEQIMGYSPEEIIGTDATTLGKLAPDELQRMWDTLRSGEEWRGEFYNKKKNGDHYWEHASISSVRNSEGVITHFIKVAEDVTEKKRAEEISEEKNKLQNYLDIAGVVLVVIDADQKVTLINRKGCQVLGYDEEEIIGKNWFDTFIPKAVRDKVKSAFAILMSGDIDPAEHFENPVLTKAGEERFIEWHNSVLRNANGRIIATLSSGEDITERKRADEKLRESEEKFRSVAQSAKEAIVSINAQGNIIFWNHGAELIFEYSAQEVAGKPLTVIMPERFREDHTRAMNRLLTGEDSIILDRTIEMVGIRRDGTELPIELSIARWSTKEEGVFFTGIIRDITSRKQTEEALQRAYGELERRIEERTLELSRANAALKQEIAVRKSAEEALTRSREELRNLTSYLQSAREEERRCIAREIHDELGQTLTALKMDLSWLKGRLPKAAGELPDKTHSMMELVDDTIHTIRKISTALRPVLLDDLGLTAAIEWQAGEFQKRTGIRCSTDLISDDIPVVPDSALAVYRIFQEALTNIARYAEATRVDVTLKVSDGTLVLHVQDNGKGITENQIADPRSIGLIGMRERARAMGGVIHIHGAQAQGTTITVNIPLGNH